MAMVTIGAVELNATEYSVEKSDVDADGTGRGEDGTMHRERIAVKHIVRGTYRVPTSSIDDVATAISGTSFSVTFFDPYVVGMSTTATMYVGNRSAKLVNLKTGSESAAYWDLTFDLIQI